MQVEPYQVIQGIILLFGIGASWASLKGDVKIIKNDVKRINGNTTELFKKTDALEKDVAKLDERTKNM